MIRLVVNGKSQNVDVDPNTPLLWVIREQVGLTGTKYGCGVAQCGACTVHVEGRATRSCITPLGAVARAKVTTIEGLDAASKHPLQIAWREVQVPQCGYCQPGQIMQACTLLEDYPEPTDRDIDAVMSGNLCRCMAYLRIRQAIKLAASRVREGTSRG